MVDHDPLAVAGPDAVAAVAELGGPTRAVTNRPPTLDDVHLQLTGVSLAA